LSFYICLFLTLSIYFSFFLPIWSLSIFTKFDTSIIISLLFFYSFF
jgi:hypothetical protein